MISLYIDREHWLHRLAAPSKLIAMALLAGFVVWADSLSLNVVLTLSAVALHLQMGPAGALALKRLLRLAPYLLFFAAVAAWQQSPRVGLTFATRILALMLCANLITISTPLSEMMACIARLLSPLRPLGVDPDRIALSLGLMIRFIPNILDRSEALKTAYRNRSGGRKLWHWRLFAPLTVQTLLMAQRVGLSLSNRLRLSNLAPDSLE